MIIIEDYNQDWPNQFEAIKADIAAVLGPLALRIDHIGSTSVPGLGAKDIIDVQVTVAELADEIENTMKAAGFTHKPYYSDHVPKGEDPDPKLWKKIYFVQRPNERRVHIHIRKLGNHNQRYALLFRDYLRAHPKSAATIEQIKRELARYHPNDWDAYYDIKDPVYDLIWDAAQGWAKTSHWDMSD